MHEPDRSKRFLRIRNYPDLKILTFQIDEDFFHPFRLKAVRDVHYSDLEQFFTARATEAFIEELEETLHRAIDYRIQNSERDHFYQVRIIEDKCNKLLTECPVKHLEFSFQRS